MALEKAFLAKASTPEDGVPVLFNPSEYTIEKSNQYAEIGIPGLASPLLQFVRGNSKTLRMELFFDTYEERQSGGETIPARSDVRAQTDKVTSFMDIDPDTHAPPICVFSWGMPEEKRKAFTGVIESISKKFTLFLSDGTPVRATLTVAFKELVDDDFRRNRRHSTNHTKTHVVRSDETLCGIAAREYGRPSDWRRIAVANGIDDPRALRPGTVLVIPVAH